MLRNSPQNGSSFLLAVLCSAELPAMPRLCQNNDCCFAPDGSRSRTLRRLGLCVFCDPTQMAEACLRRP